MAVNAAAPALLPLLLLLAAVACAAADQLPFWPQYPTRTTTVLNGEWQFGYQENIDDVINFDANKASTPNTTTVPSSFDVAPPGVMGRRGTAFYRRNLTLKANSPGLIQFAACSFYCQIHIDGSFIGDHRAGGYSSFWMDVPPSSSETRELLVIADDRFNKTTAPTHTGGDFWNYGGLTRDVILHELPAQKTYLERVETFTQDLNGTLAVRLRLKGKDDTIKVNLAFDGNKGETMTLDVQDQTATTHVTVPNAKLWSLKNPNLHTLCVTLNDGDDAITVRFGLRILGTKNGRLTINNEVVKLHGWNRHTMYPDTGSALTLDQVKADLALLKEANVNYVRGAHYPQDQRFLDLCDENGIAIWEETLGPGTSTTDFESDYFMQYQLQQVQEMVDTSINHPSVIFHGFYNEGPSNDPKACASYNASANAIRSRTYTPPSRLVTWASDKKEKDVCLDIADVVSFNSYPAWYDHPGQLNETTIFWQQIVDWKMSNYPDKPFTISETGAGGVYEWTNSSDPKWSQNYQNEVVGREAQFAIDNENITGLTLWQFNDIKANQGDTEKCGSCQYKDHPASLSKPWDCAFINVTCGRPGGENHKGSVDFWRRPKEAFNTVKAIYGKAAAQGAH